MARKKSTESRIKEFEIENEKLAEELKIARLEAENESMKRELQELRNQKYGNPYSPSPLNPYISPTTVWF